MMNKTLRILAIESSCDDTSAAVLSNQTVLSNVISTQDMHRKYGGVVPELASRSHQKNILPVVHTALEESGLEISQLDAIAYTRGPGLPGSLIVGSAFAKSLALGLNIPLIDVNHMQAHILAHFIDDGSPTPEFPFLCLTISGGHTQIVLVRDFNKMAIIGTTLDDAAGEAFDKIAKMLGLDYPGGPLVDKLSREGDPGRFSFPISDVPDFDYSFSGLKTNVLYFLQREKKKDEKYIEKNLKDICASVQFTIVSTLMQKLELAAKKLEINQIALAGGVSANSSVREAMKEREKDLGWKIYIPALEYCTDNAAMIGIAGYYKFLSGEFANLTSRPEARLAL